MRSKLLPLKFDLVKYMEGRQEVTAEELLGNAKKKYNGESQLSLPSIEKHLSALRAAGLIDMVNVTTNENGGLLCSYKLTEYGASRLKYIPAG